MIIAEFVYVRDLYFGRFLFQYSLFDWSFIQEIIRIITNPMGDILILTKVLMLDPQDEY